LVNTKFYVRLVKAFQDESVRFLYLYVVLVIGAVSVSVFNQWTLNQAGLITLLGWGALLKGAFGILLPDLSNKLIQKISLNPMVIYLSGVIMLVIGCDLLYFGFIRYPIGN